MSRAARVAARRPAGRRAAAGARLRLPALQGRRGRHGLPGGTASLPAGIYYSILLMVAAPFAGGRRARSSASLSRAGGAAAPAADAPRGRRPSPGSLPTPGSAALKRPSRPFLSPLALSRKQLRRFSPALRSWTASSPTSRRDVVAEFAANGLTEEGLSIALIDLPPSSGIFPPGRTGATSPTTRLGRQGLLPGVLRGAEAGGEAQGHAGARPRRQGHDHGLLQRRDRVRRGLDHGHDLRPGDLGPRSGRSGRSGATPSTLLPRARIPRPERQPEDVLRGRLRARAGLPRRREEPQPDDGGPGRPALQGDRARRDRRSGRNAGDAGASFPRRDAGQALRGPRARGRAARRAEAPAGHPLLGEVRRRLRLPPSRGPRGPAERARLRARGLHEGRQDGARASSRGSSRRSARATPARRTRDGNR